MIAPPFRRRSSCVAAFVMCLVFSSVASAQGRNVLLLADDETPGTAALRAALVAVGNTVTTVVPEFAWDGATPSLAQFDVVVHLNGRTQVNALPVAAQHALQSFVRSGGGYIGGQWNGLESSEGTQISMPDLVLQRWPGPLHCGPCDVTYTAAPGAASHPVLAGVPASFEFVADGHSDGELVPFATQPSRVLMTTQADAPAVTIRQVGFGRVVNFSIAPNSFFQSATLQVPFIQRLYVNAVAWAGRRPAVLLVAADDSFAAEDVRANLLAAGAFSEVDIFDARDTTPSLATLLPYRAVMTWSNAPYASPIELGNVLADYVDAGGGVVQATFSFWQIQPGVDKLGLDGRWQTGGYLPFAEGRQTASFFEMLVPNQPSHPILGGVTTFNGGTSSFRNSPIAVLPGTTLVARWSDGQPLVGTRNGPLGGHIVGLNMYPASSLVREDFWDINTDGGRLMANTLLWAAGMADSGNLSPVAALSVDEAVKEAVSEAGVSFTLDAGASSDFDRDPLTHEWTGPMGALSGEQVTITLPPPPAGSTSIPYTITLKVSDGRHAPATTTIVLTVTDTTAPVISGVPAPITAEATSAQGAIVHFAPLSATDAVDGGRPVTCDRASGDTFALGTTIVTCSSTDLHGNTIEASFDITVRDTTAPALGRITPSTPSLGTPNHGLVDVSLAYTVHDAVSAPVCTVTVNSNEGVNGRGDGNTSVDWVVVSPTLVRLRAERSALGNGRIYTVTLTCADQAGNGSTGTTAVTVAKNSKGN